MATVTCPLDPGIVLSLQPTLSLSVFIEIGKSNGDTIATLWPYFYKIISIEPSEVLWGNVAKRFEGYPQIQILLGDSKNNLSNIQSELQNVNVLYWLDANQFSATNEDKQFPQNSVIDELQSIGKLNNESVLLINGANLFLVSECLSKQPQLSQIISHILPLSLEHELIILGDVIAFFPKKAEAALEHYLRGIEQDLNSTNFIIQQLYEKEVAIYRLRNKIAKSNNDITSTKHLLSVRDKNLEEIRLVMEELKSSYLGIQAQIGAVRNLVLQNDQDLSDKTMLWLIKETIALRNLPKDSHKDALHVTLLKDLSEKKAIINDISRALNAYRAAFSIFNFFKISRVINRFRRVIAPRLGNFYQYTPRPINIRNLDIRSINLLKTPKISIVTPSFNQKEYIARTIDSVLKQRYPNLEYFIQDGGSLDGTVDVLTAYENRLTGWVSIGDEGQSQAINRAFSSTTGEIMAWLNSDDLLLPGTLLIIADYFNNHPEVDVIYGNRLLIDKDDKEIGRWIMPGHDSNVLTWVDYIPQESLFWRRSIWDKVGGQIDESFKFAMDWDLLVRFRDAGAQFAHIPLFLGAFRIHEHQKTSAAINDIGYQEMDRIRERLLGRVPTRTEIRKVILPFLLKHVAVDMVYQIKCRLWVGS
jgi:GT2 family glycosyltransferase